MITNKEILSILPYTAPFLFVDELINSNENGIVGTFHFHKDLFFFKGHFKDNPIVPGVLLIETMAQIGLVCLGIFLLNDTFNKNYLIALTATQIEFFKPVFPDEKVTVISEKIYFRFGKLKCNVVMINEKNETVCKGTISGMKTH